MADTASELRRTWKVASLPVARVLDASGATFVDLRSPAEYAEDHVPGAHSVPLFDDAQRALIGTLYRQVSPEAAFAAGRDVVEREIDALVRRIAELAHHPIGADDLAARVRRMTDVGFARFAGALERSTIAHAPERPLVLYCWRGGLRSQSVGALLASLGFERAVIVEGGYRAYRAQVLGDLARWSPPRFYVLRGLTGVGKTLVLRELERQRPNWTLDLEALAGHRSSLLGMVGLDPCSQRMFESRLRARVLEGFADFAVVEGESRKVGDVILPPNLWRALAAGTNVELEASRERRIDVLMDDYLGDERNRPPLRAQIELVQTRMKRREDRPDLTALLDAGGERELVAILLDEYYDPLYRHGEQGRAIATTFDADDPERAAADIARWIEVRERAISMTGCAPLAEP